ncbi:hypothetical protein KQI84_14495 [bacterium]|nr:hypothetical protein [bacterium]
MAKSTIEGRNVLVLGVESAPGRTCAQQLSRARCRVWLAAQNEARLDTLADQLTQKGGDVTEVVLPADSEKWQDVLRTTRDMAGHVHLVVNALALVHDGDAEAAAALARKADQVCFELLGGRGPLRMLTLWPVANGTCDPVHPEAWHGIIELDNFQRTDPTEAQPAPMDPKVLKAGAIGDAVVFLLQLPPSARPARLRLDAVPSSEKKK